MSEDDDCLKDVISYSINSPHSSAFVDINGDCINDLLIHSKYESDQFLEIWFGRKDFKSKKIKYCLKKKKKLIQISVYFP